MSEPPTVDLRAHVDAVYRRESGQIRATLIRLLGDFDSAEDAMQDAFNAALRRWPVEGLPANAALLAMQPSPVIELNRAVAVAMHEGPAAGLALIDARRIARLPLFPM
jgi:predicted RNA polymerase sigma factor